MLIVIVLICVIAYWGYRYMAKQRQVQQEQEEAAKRARSVLVSNIPGLKGCIEDCFFALTAAAHPIMPTSFSLIECVANEKRCYLITFFCSYSLSDMPACYRNTFMNLHVDSIAEMDNEGTTVEQRGDHYILNFTRCVYDSPEQFNYYNLAKIIELFRKSGVAYNHTEEKEQYGFKEIHVGYLY